MSAKRFRIAFSFAGEKRDFVAQVASILAKRFGEDSILYDKYHKAEFSRSDLAFYLPDLYEKETDLVVAVFCPDYDKKDWCGLEWNAIYGLLKARKVGEVMLTRFEHVEGKGLRGIAGYVDLDDLTSDQAANLILERLALNEGLPKDHYKTVSMENALMSESTIGMAHASDANFGHATTATLGILFEKLLTQKERVPSRNETFQIDALELCVKLLAIPPLQQDALKENYKGYWVHCWTTLSSASKDSSDADRCRLQLHPEMPEGYTTLIECSVRLADYPILKDLHRGARIRVKGQIDDFGLFSVRLVNTTIEFPERPLGGQDE